MQATLEDFFKALRRSDLNVSLSARIEAGQAADLVGLADRETLKNALGTTLAKSIDDRRLFDDCFEKFFTFDTFQAKPVENGDLPSPAFDVTASQDQTAAGESASGPGSGSGSSSDETNNGLTAMLMARDSAGLAQAVQQAARQAGMTNIWFFMQKGYYIQQIQRRMGVEQLDQKIALLARKAGETGQETEADAQSRLDQLDQLNQLRLVRRRLFEEVRGFVEKQLSLYGTAPTRQLHDDFLQEQRLSNIEQRDLQRMHEIVRKLTKRLAERHSRRKKQESRGQLDFRKTLRKNAAYDGMLFNIHWKSKVIEKPKVIAICDVSGSVRGYARFLLLFMYSLNELLSEIRSFAFTNRLEEVTSIFEDLPVAQAVDKVMKETAGGGTDYGQVLCDIEDQLLSDVDRKTTILILGDARNNRGNPHASTMKLLHQRAKRVIWLNPESRAAWGLGDSEMLRYAPYCHAVKECSTVKQLERAMDELLRSAAHG